jgi:hypothetical protein
LSTGTTLSLQITLYISRGGLLDGQSDIAKVSAIKTDWLLAKKTEHSFVL